MYILLKYNIKIYKTNIQNKIYKTNIVSKYTKQICKTNWRSERKYKQTQNYKYKQTQNILVTDGRSGHIPRNNVLTLNRNINKLLNLCKYYHILIFICYNIYLFTYVEF